MFDRQIVFRTSSFCQDGGCVEVAVLPDGDALVRDKKNLDSPIIPVGAAAWRAFLDWQVRRAN